MSINFEICNILFMNQDKDGCLSPSEVADLFSTCPVIAWGPEIVNVVPTNEHGWITLQGYLAQWT